MPTKPNTAGGVPRPAASRPRGAGPPGSDGRLSFLIGCSTLVSPVVERRCEISPVQLFFLPLFCVCACVHDGRGGAGPGAAATRVLGGLDMTGRRGYRLTLPRGAHTLPPRGREERVAAFCAFSVVIASAAIFTGPKYCRS